MEEQLTPQAILDVLREVGELKVSLHLGETLMEEWDGLHKDELALREMVGSGEDDVHQVHVRY